MLDESRQIAVLQQSFMVIEDDFGGCNLERTTKYFVSPNAILVVSKRNKEEHKNKLSKFLEKIRASSAVTQR